MAYIFAKIQQLKVKLPNVTICNRISLFELKITQYLSSSVTQWLSNSVAQQLNSNFPQTRNPQNDHHRQTCPCLPHPIRLQNHCRIHTLRRLRIVFP